MNLVRTKAKIAAVRWMSTSQKDLFVPEQKIEFKDQLLEVYRCRPETLKIKRFQYYPLPPLIGLGSIIAYKTLFWSGYLWVILPTLPIAMLMTARRTIIDNCEASIETIWLDQSGAQILIKDLTGRKVRHPIETLRRATDEEIIKLNRAGGPAFVEKMKEFYPIVVQSNQQTDQIGSSLLDLLLIDHKGTVANKQLLSAILNGIQVKTSTNKDFIDV